MIKIVAFAAALLLPLAAPAAIAAQDGPARMTVTGQVLDRETREPIAGALIEVPGLGSRAGTDADGQFRIQVREGEHLFMVRRLGYAELNSALTIRANTGRVTFMLDPQAALLEGITVVYNAFERRRQRITAPSHVLERTTLLNRSGSLADVVANSPYFVSGGSACGSDYCANSRGSAVAPMVYIDDIRAIGGMIQLAGYSPAEMQRVEVYRRGAMVRAYTEAYVERVASGRGRLRPFFEW
jgi:hypothetical protein